MSFLVRPINGTLGSAIAIREGLGEENKLAVFAEAAIQDYALVGDDRCILVSRKRGIALVDLASCSVVKRARLSLTPDRISVSQDASRAIAYHCNPGLILVIDLATLEETARYNLIQARDGCTFELLHRDHDALQRDKTAWDSIPFSDGPLASEVAEDDFWLKHGSDEPTGLRRIRFTRAARARFRADGKVVMPFEFGTIGREWVVNRHGAKPITSRARDFRVGVAVIDLDTARLEMKVIRRRIEQGVSSSFAVQSISPDGSRAILQSFDPVVAGSETEERGLGGMVRKMFGRKVEKDLAFGLEVWNIEVRPELAETVAFRTLHSETLLRGDTQRFGDAEIADVRKEIDLVFPGLEAAFADRAEAWRASPEKQTEDAYFDPLETRAAPAFNPAFNRVHYLSLFAETTRRLVKLHPTPFSAPPWENLGDRQCRFLASALGGWGKHSAHAATAIAWSSRDRLVVLSRDGTVREISLSAGIGPAYRLVNPAGDAWPFSDRDTFPPELIHLHGNAFAVDLYNFRLEFDLPSSDGQFGPGNLTISRPLAYRVVKDGEAHKAEVQQVDRLAEMIRRGYVKISSKDPARIIAGLRELAGEVRDHLDEIVVDHRWLPSLHCRGKAITETEFCGILVADGSDEAVDALVGLLSAYLDATKGKHENVWHPNDGTPTLGPVAFALIRMCDPIPPSVADFFARRDMNHDMWTFGEFERLALPPERYLSSDLMTLQIRLAIQDICTGNVEADLFALYRLPFAREALRANPSLAPEFATAIFAQLEAQSPDLTWASGAGVSGVLEAIAEGFDAEDGAEAALAAELRRRAKAHPEQ